MASAGLVVSRSAATPSDRREWTITRDPDGWRDATLLAADAPPPGM